MEYIKVPDLTPEWTEELKKVQRDVNQLEIMRFLRYLPDAIAQACKSKDRSTKVGAIALDNDLNVRSSGRNGFPRGVNDQVEERHQRPLKYKWSCHSEENVVAQAARVGASLYGCTLLVTALHPCTTCSRMAIQAGIARILAPAANDGGTGPNRHDWDEEARIAMEMLEEAGVEVLYYTQEQAREALSVFRKHFNDIDKLYDAVCCNGEASGKT